MWFGRGREFAEVETSYCRSSVPISDTPTWRRCRASRSGRAKRMRIKHIFDLSGDLIALSQQFGPAVSEPANQDFRLGEGVVAGCRPGEATAAE